MRHVVAECMNHRNSNGAVEEDSVIEALVEKFGRSSPHEEKKSQPQGMDDAVIATEEFKEPVGEPQKKEPIVTSVQASSTAIPETKKIDMKAVAQKLTAAAKAIGIRFPKTWDETQLR